VELKILFSWRKRNARGKKKYYFSDNLKRQLANISNYPLTIIEAPSGFGKTTAVREFLKENLSEEEHEYWHTCLGESSSITWVNICEMIAKMNEKVADDLKNLNMPTKNTLNYMLSFIKNIKCNTKTFMVVDNYQLIKCDVPYELLNVFSSHGNSNLHLIFITQQLETRFQFIVHSENIYLIGGKTFFLTKWEFPVYTI
jgi:LuxR family maltose regulon positive regulatory protein